jgi:hypothetical protein
VVAIGVARKQQWRLPSIQGQQSRTMCMKRILAVFLGGSLALAAFATLPALAQEGAPQQPGTIVQQGDVNDQFPPDGKKDEVDQVDQVDRIAGGPARGGMRSTEGVRLVRPGALLFASFDRNFDGKVTREEIETGAAGAFAAADKNKDGKVSGFEQNDWAASVGGQHDVLSNPMTFDIDLDRTITSAEFSTGLKRIADQMMGPGGVDISFAELVKPLTQPDRQAQGGPVPIGPRAGGSNVSPSGLRRP